MSCIYLLIICVIYTLVFDIHNGFFQRRYYHEAVNVLKYIAIILIGLIAVLYLVKFDYTLSRLVFTYFTVVNLFLTFFGHMTFKRYMVRKYRHSDNSSKVMVLTNKVYAEDIITTMFQQNAWEYQVTAVGIMDENCVKEEICGVPVIADKNTLYEVVRQMTLDEVFICLPDCGTDQLRALIQDFENMGVTCHLNVDVPKLNLVGKRAGFFAGYTVLSFSMQQFDYRKILIKRCMDIVGGLVGTIGTLILMPFIALAIKLESKGPVIFAQTRIGKNGRRFKIYKFRSMYIDAEERKKKLMEQNEVKGLMFKIEKDPRITKVGAFIRKTSLDELPQFFNILKGDMSLIGTRPPTLDEFEQYNMYYRRRLCITPGLTGMWQVSGRSNITDFDEVVKLDLEYIDHWSLGLDIKILMQTFLVVITRSGSK